MIYIYTLQCLSTEVIRSILQSFACKSNDDVKMVSSLVCTSYDCFTIGAAFDGIGQHFATTHFAERCKALVFYITL